jgi:hypothetical protein
MADRCLLACYSWKMSTPKQIAVSRLDPQEPAGPRFAEGEAAPRANSKLGSWQDPTSSPANPIQPKPISHSPNRINKKMGSFLHFVPPQYPSPPARAARDWVRFVKNLLPRFPDSLAPSVPNWVCFAKNAVLGPGLRGASTRACHAGTRAGAWRPAGRRPGRPTRDWVRSVILPQPGPTRPAPAARDWVRFVILPPTRTPLPRPAPPAIGFVSSFCPTQDPTPPARAARDWVRFVLLPHSGPHSPGPRRPRPVGQASWPLASPSLRRPIVGSRLPAFSRLTRARMPVLQVCHHINKS